MKWKYAISNRSVMIIFKNLNYLMNDNVTQKRRDVLRSFFSYKSEPQEILTLIYNCSLTPSYNHEVNQHWYLVNACMVEKKRRWVPNDTVEQTNHPIPKLALPCMSSL